MSPFAIFNGGVNITDATQDEEKDKNLHIVNIPNDLYWEIVRLKGRLNSVTWLDFLKTILTAQIDTKEPLLSTKIEPVERILINNIPLETFNALKDLKAKHRAKTWLELLALLATADIKPPGPAPPVLGETRSEAIP